MLEMSVTSLRPGNYVFFDRSIFELVTYEHVKPGKGGAFVRLKMKNVESGAVLEKTCDADSRLPQVDVMEHQAQYLYRQGDQFVFMNLESFEQTEIPAEKLGRDAGFMKPEIEVKIIECEGRILGVKLPLSVALKVAETPPGVKGDTVVRGTKPATLETGVVVNVPLFINAGDTIKLDTRTGDYMERA